MISYSNLPVSSRASTPLPSARNGLISLLIAFCIIATWVVSLTLWNIYLWEKHPTGKLLHDIGLQRQ